MSLKAVLFDMDGVIVDTEPLHKKAYFKMFTDVNIDVSQELYESFTGQSTINICKELCKQYSLSESPETLVQLKRKHFKYLFANDTDLSLLSGVLHLIKNLFDNGITLVLASSASMPNIDRIFKRFDLDQFFIAKLSGADLKESKPHPEIFINAAKASGYDRKNCVVIEDSTNGISAAKAAGIFCIGYNSLHSKNQDYSKADWVVNDFSKLSYKEINAKLVLKNKVND